MAGAGSQPSLTLRQVGLLSDMPQRAVKTCDPTRRQAVSPFSTRAPRLVQ